MGAKLHLPRFLRHWFQNGKSVLNSLSPFLLPDIFIRTPQSYPENHKTGCIFRCKFICREYLLESPWQFQHTMIMTQLTQSISWVTVKSLLVPWRNQAYIYCSLRLTVIFWKFDACLFLACAMVNSRGRYNY